MMSIFAYCWLTITLCSGKASARCSSQSRISRSRVRRQRLRRRRDSIPAPARSGADGYRMPGPSSFEPPARLIRKERPDSASFSSPCTTRRIRRRVRAVEPAATFLKESPGSQLLTAIREVCRAAVISARRLLTRLVDDIRVQGPRPIAPASFDALTKREVKTQDAGRGSERQGHRLGISS